jgi:hypothetical protein
LLKVLDSASKHRSVVDGDPRLLGETVLDAVVEQGEFKVWAEKAIGEVLGV